MKQTYKHSWERPEKHEVVTWRDTRDALLGCLAIPAFVVVGALLLIGQAWFITTVWEFVFRYWWAIGFAALVLWRMEAPKP